MRKLYHWPLDPASRLVRLVLAEKHLDFELVVSPPWKPVEEVKRLFANPVGPVLVDQGVHGRVVANTTHAIIEYLEEQYPQIRVLPQLSPDRAEARRVWRWAEQRFELDINGSILAERIAQAVQRTNVPDSTLLRSGAHALKSVLTYLTSLTEQHSYLTGRLLTVADLAVAANLSALDYFGDVPWDNAPDVRDWYVRVKSRPCFRALLKDQIVGTKPAPHYADLDF